MNLCKCGSYAINDDPQRELCDSCWRDRTIAEQQAEIERLTAALETATKWRYKNDDDAESLGLRVVRQQDEIRRLNEQLDAVVKKLTAVGMPVARCQSGEIAIDVSRSALLLTACELLTNTLRKDYLWGWNEPLQCYGYFIGQQWIGNNILDVIRYKAVRRLAAEREEETT